MSSRIVQRRSAGMCKAARYCDDNDMSAAHTPLGPAEVAQQALWRRTRRMLERVCDVQMSATTFRIALVIVYHLCKQLL